MTEEQYKEDAKKIEQSYRKALKELALEYVLANAKYKIGDIIKSDKDIILVGKVDTWMRDVPNIVYKGTELTQELTPKEHQMGRVIVSSWKIELIKPQP